MNITLRFAPAAIAVLWAGSAACETPRWASFEATYTADVVAPVSGADGDAAAADLMEFTLDADLARFGLKGVIAHGSLQSTQGGQPNDPFGALQGVDNIEVGAQRLRLFEAWIQAPIGEHGSILAGLFDLNSEFYANDPAGMLMGPSFGIGPEIAATGANGPSLFPSASLAVRVAVEYPGAYARAAVFNARAGVPGDPGGVDTGFDDGVLAIAEAGLTREGKLAIGAWRYSREQARLRPVPGADRSSVGGVYVLADRKLWGEDEGRKVEGFLRLGASDGRTTPFSGSSQFGLLVTRPFAGRPDSLFSVGVEYAALSSDYRASLRDAGVAAADNETLVELTYSDQIFDRLTIQPDLQVIFNPAGRGDARTALALGVRLVWRLTP